MPIMENMVWPSWTHKSSATKDYNFIPQMQNKFVERAFLVGGFVGSKSQAGSSPFRAQISLNDVILEQILQQIKMIPEKVQFQNFNPCNWKTNNPECNNYNYDWRSNMGSHTVNNCTSTYFNQYYGSKTCGPRNSKTSNKVPPEKKHSQEEIVYEDKDEGGNSIYVYQEVQKSTCEVTKTSMFHVRSRTISDCSIESDDSFIIFESSEDDVIGNEEDNEDDVVHILGNCEFDDSSSDESFECDEVDYFAPVLECHSQSDTPSCIEEANKKWNEIYDSIPSSEKTPKKVSFASGKELAKVRTMCTWDYAHRAARVGPWETLGRDAARFQTKIQKLSNIISPILERSHRKRIFQQRFRTSHPNCSHI